MVDEAGRNNGKEYQHQVIISKNFYLGAYEITQAQYYSIMGVYPSEHDGSKIGESRDNLPVELVSYDDIVSPTDGFLAKLNKHFKDTNQLPTGYKFDLPTETQWEYACRAGTKTTLNSGKNITANSTCPNLDEVA